MRELLQKIDPMEAGAMALASIAAAAFAWALAKAPSRPNELLGPRGLRRRRALRESAAFGIVEPLLRWAGARASGLVPSRLRSAIDARLARGGFPLGLTADEYLALVAVGASAGAASSVYYMYVHDTGAVSPVVGFVLGAWIVQSRLDDSIARRAREMTNGLPYVVDLLSLAMTAGLDFPGAVRNVVARSTRARDALTEELEHVLSELALGHTRKHALEQLADRSQVPAVMEMVSAVMQSEARGSPLVEILGVQAQVLRQKRSTNAEEAASRAAHAMAVPLAFLAASTILLMVAPMLIKVLAAFRSLG